MSTMNRLVGFFFLCICMLVRLPSSSSAAAVVGHATATNTMIPPAKTQLPTNEIEKEEEIDTPRDVVIIGSGPSGCTAAIYTARAMLRPLVIAGYQAGGQLMLTSDVENFPGYREAISGPDMMEDLMEQAKKYGAVFWQTNCKSIDLSERPFKVNMHNGTIETHSIILSTGAEALWLDAPREEEFKGKGISTCATCDGYMFRNKDICVIGGGDSAMEEANFLTRFASSVTIIHRRDTFRASKVMLNRALNNAKIRVLKNTVVKEWKGDDGILSGATLSVDGTEQNLDVEGAFIAIGHKPNTQFLGGQIECDQNGYIKVLNGEMTKTSVEGVFACGDVVDTKYKQAITAAGSGCQAAIDAEKWLEARVEMNNDGNEKDKKSKNNKSIPTSPVRPKTTTSKENDKKASSTYDPSSGGV